MIKNEKNLFYKYVSKNVRLSISIVYVMSTLVGILLFYYFLPILLNYGPGTINTDFDRQFSSGITYFLQFALIYFGLTVIGIPLILWYTRDLKNISAIKKASLTDKTAEKKLNKIVYRCMSFPQYSFITLSFVPTLLVSIAFLFLKFTSLADLKVVLVTFVLSLLVSSLTYISMKSIFKIVLTNIGNTIRCENSNFSFTTTLILQLSSMLFVCLLFTLLLSYSNHMNDKSQVLAKHYKYEVVTLLKNNQITSIEELQNILLQINFISNTDTVFLIDESGKFVNFVGADVSDFFQKYALELSEQNDNFVYDYYGTETQGIVIPVNINGMNIKVVVKYDLSNIFSKSTFFNLAIIILYCIIAIYFFSSSVTKSISIVTDSMENILNKSSDNTNVAGERLAITSNDETGDLIVAFNKIQDLTEKHIHQIQDNQQALLEQERLASLGQMIGGIAHNLKTPIMSIAGAAEALTELVTEYVASINNPVVTPDDHKEIARDMLEWIQKIKSHTTYMSDIITTVKGQATQFSGSGSDTFSVYDLSKRVDILMKHELKRALVELKTTLDCSPILKLQGDINTLVQVINNLISNSIHSYNNKPNQVIEFNISTDERNIYFSIIDTGCGIPKEIQEKLFKEMCTTKGKNGTGLGLYMSYSTIKGKFNGDLTFKSEVGKGTTFMITIPLNNK